MNTGTKAKQNNQSSNTTPGTRSVRMLFGGWILAFKDLNSGLIVPFQNLESKGKAGALLLLSLVITWFVYVPIHELLHVAGCIITGGTVSELVMGREYGADFLARFFPFITPATTQYAGRVTGFEPNGDLGYLVTVFAPYILTLFPGVWFVGRAIFTGKLWFFGPGIVIGLASFYNLTGDYFEMGTILSTRLVDWVTGGSASGSISAFSNLRSDDLFRLISEISEAPGMYGLDHPTGLIGTLSIITIGLCLAIVLAGWTYILGRRLSGRQMTRFEQYDA